MSNKISISVFILNPPYNDCQKHNENILDKITEIIRYKQPQKYIQIQPISSKTRYKTAEFVGNPFDIRWSNIFIFDMLGNKNEYFSHNEMSLWDKDSNKCLWLHENPPKVYITETDEETHKRRFNVKDTQETYDFINWINTNEIGIFYITYIRTTLPSRYMINKLWEIYNAEN